jgi:predicted HTH transcriptional regulator
MPIPDSSLPGHRALHERTIAALEICQETVNVEFKSSGSWADLENKIVKNILGMGNLRDGGLLVIGVSENGNRWELAGILPEHLRSFEPDDVLAHVGRYVSPVFEIDVVTVTYATKQFLTIHTHEFADTPLVCKKNGPDGAKNEGLACGGIYVRLPAPPQTTRVMDAAQLHALLELAAEKRARRMLEQVRRIGALDVPEQDALNAELEGL